MCDFQGDKCCKKASMKVDASYFWGSSLTLGRVTNISKNCMCINTKYSIPLKSKINLFLPTKRKVLDIPVRINSYTDLNSHHDIMMVEIINPSYDYLEYEKSIN